MNAKNESPRPEGGAPAVDSYDVVVVGSGPAGHKAAIQAAKAGRSVLVIEREESIGGACVHRGTIPSKTLRETALALSEFPRKTGRVFDVERREDLEIASLLTRMEHVVKAHERFMSDQLRRNGAIKMHGRARFVDPHHLEVETVTGVTKRIRGEYVVIATGSRPRTPSDVPVDHEHVLDSDSILSMTWLPQSLTVLGAGVIASEYASIFGALGVKVTMIDKGARPLGFIDPEIVERFVTSFRRAGGRFLGGHKVAEVKWDGVDKVVTRLDDGTVVESEKMLCCLGRVANLDGLDLAKTGLAPDERGLLQVDEHCKTKVAHVYAVGDVIGPPSLASSSMEQGRRAMCDALGIALGHGSDFIPAGIYTIPEMSQVGLSEAEAVSKYGAAMVGRAKFDELARGQISAIEDGLLKLVADPGGKRVLGVQIVGEGACELIHVGQMALLADAEVDTFVENIFNFPTLAEAYRVAALDVAKQRKKLLGAAGPGANRGAPKASESRPAGEPRPTGESGAPREPAPSKSAADSPAPAKSS